MKSKSVLSVCAKGIAEVDVAVGMVGACAGALIFANVISVGRS